MTKICTYRRITHYESHRAENSGVQSKHSTHNILILNVHITATTCSASKKSPLDYLPWINQIIWVECVLDVAHQLQFQRTFIMIYLISLELSQSMLCADTAV